MLRYYQWKKTHVVLLLCLLAISLLGVRLVSSADPSLMRRQLLGVALGFVLLLGVSLIDYSWILHFYWVLYAVTLALLLSVLLFGTTNLGAQRWINIFGFQFQPIELAKILLILFFAMYFDRLKERRNTWRAILTSIGLLLAPLVLLLLQPDLKNPIMLTLLVFGMYFVSGLSYKRVGQLILIAIPMAAILLFLITQTNLPILRDYQKGRVMSFFNAEDDEYSESRMQQENSIIAIGSGQLLGKGLGSGEEPSANRGNFIAENQNDFILAVAGEEMGFAGCMLIVLLEGGLVAQCFRIGRQAKDESGRLVCVGLGSLLALQSFINMGVASGILPNTGTTLPFVSYGLTSLVSLFIGMGIVMNVSLQRKDPRAAASGGRHVYEGPYITAEEFKA